jgi:archaemetzincin
MIEVVAVGEGVESRRLNLLATELARIFRVPCHVRGGVVDLSTTRDAAREQYHSTAILSRLRCIAPDSRTRVLGIAAVDLFVPIFTFVFGEAEIGGNCALASLYRLHEELYGLPANEERLRERLIKEAVHELGHTFGLRHCDHWHCVMASSHSVELVDVKSAEFCEECARLVYAAGSARWDSDHDLTRGQADARRGTES